MEKSVINQIKMLRSPRGCSLVAFTYRKEEIIALEEVNAEHSKAH